MHVTRAELDALLPEIIAAPKEGAAVSYLCLRPARNLRSFPEVLDVSRAAGIKGDRWLSQPWLKLPDGKPHPDIQISILNSRILNACWRDREVVPHPGDSFCLDMDLSTDNLPEGQLIQAGSAILRVSGTFNNGCAKWKVRYGRESVDWINLPAHQKLRLRGVLCAVHQDGQIRNGDIVRKL